MKVLPNRKSIRLEHHNYSSPGWYFVTICSHNRSHLFGKVNNGKMELNTMGKIVKNVWKSLPNHHYVKLDVFQIMPDHVHFILVIPPHGRGIACNARHNNNNAQCNDGVTACVNLAYKLQPNSNTQSNGMGLMMGGVSFAHTDGNIAHTDGVGFAHKTHVTTFGNITAGSLPCIIRSFKSECTKQIRYVSKNHHAIWQRGYYEHIIRTKNSLHQIQKYIKNNPLM